MNLEPGETLLLEKAANIRKAKEYAGGKLVLTNRRLIIIPHAINLDTKQVEIALSDIAAVEPFNTLGLVPNGVRIRRKDGTEELIVVWGREAVMAAIRMGAGV